MALKPEEVLILAKQYAKATAEGAGAIKGDTGKSAYEIAVQQGFEGTEDDWLNSLKAVGSWNEIENKPFKQIGENGLIVENDALNIDFSKVSRPIINQMEGSNSIEFSDGAEGFPIYSMLYGNSVAEPAENLMQLQDGYYGNGDVFVDNGTINIDSLPSSSIQITIPIISSCWSRGESAVLSFSNSLSGNYSIFLTSRDADGCRTESIDMSSTDVVAYFSADSAVYSITDYVEVDKFGDIAWENLVIEIPSGSEINQLQLYPQFEIGTEAHGFSPYGTNDIRPDRPATIKHVTNPSVELNGITEIEFEGITLRAVGNSADYIDLEKGVIVRNVGEALMLDSTVKAEQGLTETVTISSYGTLTSNGNYYSLRMYPSSLFQVKLKIFSNTNLLESPVLSNKFTYARQDRGRTPFAYSIGRLAGANPILEVTLDIPQTATTTEATERFREMQPFTLVYEAVETEEALSEDVLNKLRSVYGNNIISVNNDDGVSTRLVVKYTADTKLYIDRKLEELSNAIVALATVE